MPKNQPLEFILELLVIAEKQQDWRKVKMAIECLYKYGTRSRKDEKKLRKKLESEQVNNHHLQNKLKDIK